MLLCTKQVISVKLSRPMSKIWRPPVCPMLPAWKAGTRLMFARVSWQTCHSQKRRRGGLSEIFLGFSVAGDVRINRSRRGKKDSWSIGDTLSVFWLFHTLVQELDFTNAVQALFGPSYWVERVVFLGPLAMVSVAHMLKWKCPPIFIMIILLLRFGTPNSTTPETLDFVEIFAGKAELSKSLREVSNLILRFFFFYCLSHFPWWTLKFMFCCDPTRCPKAQYVGVSIDFDRDERTQDLLKPPGFLFLGKLFFFFLGRHLYCFIFTVSKNSSHISLYYPPKKLLFWVLGTLLQQIRLCISQILKCKKGALVMIAICCKSFSAMFLVVKWCFFLFRGIFKHLKVFFLAISGGDLRIW